MSSRKWIIEFLAVCGILLGGLGAITVIIDPYFHYHKPLDSLQYPISNERYQNNGIVKHFEYDAVITGTSMTQNFKTSEFDEIFHVNSVKVPFSGASYKEINDNLTIAVESNPNIKIILRGLDYNRLLDEKNEMRYDMDFYPWYLYDDVPYNDVKYIFNKTVLFQTTLGVLEYTRDGGKTTDFDEYSNWMECSTFGKETVDATYTRADRIDVLEQLSTEDYKNINENVTQNITELADAHPEIDFYLFFTPYSIYYWDSLNQMGILEKQLEAEKYVIELLLLHDNIHLFSFFTEFDMICNLDNYKDIAHYGENVNSQILLWMLEGKHEITRENYQEYCQVMKNFYTNYDYDALFE